MQFGVFVDWPFNTNEQAVRFELSECVWKSRLGGEAAVGRYHSLA